MPSKREQVLEAVKALVTTALPGADVKRNQAKPERIGPGGHAVIRDGDPGEPDVTLSPLTYLYTHVIPVEVAAYEGGAKTREQVLDEMMSAIGEAMDADRTLGGLCDWLDAAAPSPDDAETSGAEPFRWADVGLIAVYSTTTPLT